MRHIYTPYIDPITGKPPVEEDPRFPYEQGENTNDSKEGTDEEIKIENETQEDDINKNQEENEIQESDIIENQKENETQKDDINKNQEENEIQESDIIENQKENETQEDDIIENQEVLDSISDLDDIEMSYLTEESSIDSKKIVNYGFKTSVISRLANFVYIMMKYFKQSNNKVDHLMKFEDVNVNFEPKPVDLEFNAPVKLELDTKNFGDLISSVKKVTDKMADIEISLANFYDSFSFDESNESNAVSLAVNSLRIATKQLAEDSAIIKENMINTKIDAENVDRSIMSVKNIIETYDINVKNSLNRISDAYNLIKTNTEFVNKNFSSYMEKVETDSSKINELYLNIEKACESFKIQYAFVSNDLKQISQRFEDLRDSLNLKNTHDLMFRDKLLKMFLYFGITIVILFILKMLLGVLL